MFALSALVMKSLTIWLSSTFWNLLPNPCHYTVCGLTKRNIPPPCPHSYHPCCLKGHPIHFHVSNFYPSHMLNCHFLREAFLDLLTRTPPCFLTPSSKLKKTLLSSALPGYFFFKSSLKEGTATFSLEFESSGNSSDILERSSPLLSEVQDGIHLCIF